ncbi:MAG: calcium-binding protein, partial [Planctomycetota bacterium]|nr:calcium-binding protein [Planctomycetota bacterium]
NPSLSADGTKVAFQTLSDPVNGGATSIAQIYVRDHKLSTMDLVSCLSPTEAGDLASTNPAISGDGTLIAFETFAKNLDGYPSGGVDNDNESDIYCRDIVGLTTSLISRDDTGEAGPKGDGSSYNASISYDGSCIAFQSHATNLITGLPDGISSDIFVRVNKSETYMISTHTSGGQGEGSCILPSISGDGRYVVFQSDEASLVNDDNNFSEDIFLRDRTREVTTRISVATFGVEAINDSKFPAISQDGRYAAFWSIANNLASDDSNGSADIFRRGPFD